MRPEGKAPAPLPRGRTGTGKWQRCPAPRGKGHLPFLEDTPALGSHYSRGISPGPVVNPDLPLPQLLPPSCPFFPESAPDGQKWSREGHLCTHRSPRKWSWLETPERRTGQDTALPRWHQPQPGPRSPCSFCLTKELLRREATNTVLLNTA